MLNHGGGTAAHSRASRSSGSSKSARAAVFPNTFQRQLEPAVNATLNALLGKGRAHHVAAKSLELGAVVAVNELLFVDTDASASATGCSSVLLLRSSLEDPPASTRSTG